MKKGEPKLHGIRGWLLIFIIFLILDMLRGLGAIISIFFGHYFLAGTGLVLLIISFIPIIPLIKKLPRAVKITIVTLIIGAFLNVVFMFLILSQFYPIIPKNPLFITSFSILSIWEYITWILYFLKSKRVRNTYKNPITNPKRKIKIPVIIIITTVIAGYLLLFIALFTANFGFQYHGFALAPGQYIIYFNAPDNENNSSFNFYATNSMSYYVIRNETLGITLEEFAANPYQYVINNCYEENKKSATISCDIPFGRIVILNNQNEEVNLTIETTSKLRIP